MEKVEWIKSNYGSRLRRARQKARLNQSELADQLKTKQPTISRAEDGKFPREPIRSRIASFVTESEKSHHQGVEEALAAIRNSEELKALVIRILADTN